MVNVLYLGILKNEQKPAVELCSERDLSDYGRFTKGSVNEFLTLFSKTIAERTKPGQRQGAKEQSYTLNCYARSEGIAGVIVTRQEYDPMNAQAVLSKIVDEFLTKYPRSTWANSDNPLPFPQLKEYIVKFQDPGEISSISKIQRELDETKYALYETIEKVLERGEKIDSLVAKSDGLSTQSKMFYTQAKRQNSCCVVM